MSISALGNAIRSRIIIELTEPGRILWNLFIRPNEYWNLVIRPGEYTGIWLFARDIKNDSFLLKMSISALGNAIRSRIIIELLSPGEYSGI